MELVAAIIMSALCMLVAVRRLSDVLRFPRLDLRTLISDAKERKDAVIAVLSAEGEEGSWERLCAEGARLRGDAALATLNEALLELEQRLSRGARVPRVTASIASSVGFLLASLVLRRGLLSAADEPIPVFDGLIVVALNVVSVGIAGAVTCAAAGNIATRIAKVRWKEGEALVEALRPADPAGPLVSEATAAPGDVPPSVPTS